MTDVHTGIVLTDLQDAAFLGIEDERNAVSIRRFA